MICEQNQDELVTAYRRLCASFSRKNDGIWWRWRNGSWPRPCTRIRQQSPQKILAHQYNFVNSRLWEFQVWVVLVLISHDVWLIMNDFAAIPHSQFMIIQRLNDTPGQWNNYWRPCMWSSMAAALFKSEAPGPDGQGFLGHFGRLRLQTIDEKPVLPAKNWDGSTERLSSPGKYPGQRQTALQVAASRSFYSINLPIIINYIICI